MTAPATKTVRSDADKQSGANVRRGGRNFMIAFYAALRAIKLYPLEHSAVQKTLTELAQVAEELRTEEGDLEFRISGEFIFLNETRLRLDLSNYATFGHILTLCKLAGIGAIHVGNKGTARDWTLLLSLLGAETKSSPAERFKEIVARLKEAKIETFQLDAPAESASDKEFNEEAKAAANRTYSQSVAVTKDVINSVRIGKTPNIRKIKRVVQGIVDELGKTMETRRAELQSNREDLAQEKARVRCLVLVVLQGLTLEEIHDQIPLFKPADLFIETR